MSTDTLDTPLLAAPRRQGYAFIKHRNSNQSRKKGLVGWTIGKFGKPEFRNHTTYQTIRHPEGGPLPHQPLLVKRNRYTPHVGAKQLAKAAR